ncbi:hypothetical protein IMCC20628_04531 [Hoeflea sp. IMCC20628]|uniref:SIR2 family protein n=1 Tax=Hoeflea sp. IMCC20628 TaxID=1620421 RepID=UPI00063BF36A|nr:SIR2 family protein [Hoeflea sp. IMCC20628]AKI03201.1 hypothetical protein IMCC20628_04531 [Hoeflea sp. IMCC20628]
MRKTYIFGNGLGMAISPDAYNLTSAMSKAWDEGALAPEQKELISACLPDGDTCPTSEEQLATLQDTVSACEVLLSVRDTGAGHWLSSQGRQFPEAVHKFAYLVARQMYLAQHSTGQEEGNRCVLPEDFLDPLAAEIKSSQSHVATLNYDGLLSSALRNKKILGGDEPILFDGFVDKKFDRQNLFRNKRFGAWYLHLHGGPLFAGKAKAKPFKLTEVTLSKNPKTLKNVGRHIVLTHYTHKPKIIDSSEVLSIYWEFLEMAVDESLEVVLFGYSGNDIHLNRLISQLRGTKVVRVVDWLGAGNKASRTKFWNEQLGGDVELHLLEDVLTFTEW